MEREKRRGSQDKLEITYEDYLHACFDGIVQISRELEKTLGKDKAHEVIIKARVKADLELVKKQLNGKTIDTFEDFKTFMRKLIMILISYLFKISKQ